MSERVFILHPAPGLNKNLKKWADDNLIYPMSDISLYDFQKKHGVDGAIKKLQQMCKTETIKEYGCIMPSFYE